MIQSFKEIIQQRQWTNQNIVDSLNGMENRLAQRSPNHQLTLTSFQRRVLQDPEFWRDWEKDPRHLMIQGATSAGKTLVSELSTLDTLQQEKKAIVLVPLKAMVHERTMQFRADMGCEKPDCEFRVFGASSDYMEYDEQLIKGAYDVAIIVYEKFFAMLNQTGSRIMEDCGLLVVDELSMLSQEQRGPKLEMALEIVERNFPDTRIICLATCDCDTTHICQWLNIERPIFSSARPVALEEHILLWSGKGKKRIIPAEQESEPLNTGEAYEIKDYKYSPDLRPAEKRKKLLLAVLREIWLENSKNMPKVLVFVGSRSEASEIAFYLKKNGGELWGSGIGHDHVFEEFRSSLAACDRDDDLNNLLNDLIPQGIVYHHAGLSTDVRELIEREFQRLESPLNIIVATETLTVGVNMPFDVMIMVDNKVPRGKGDREALNGQEYRNYIGRAGRLGQGRINGKTYLFVEDQKTLDRYWKSYSSRDGVKSALTISTVERSEKKRDKARDEENQKNLYEKRLAPYYLSLLATSNGSTVQPFQSAAIEELYQGSLSKSCEESNVEFDAKRLCEELYNAYMIQKKDIQQHMIPQRASQHNVDTKKGAQYKVTTFGKNIVPYALSTETCLLIYWYFYKGYEHGGFPLGISKTDIDSDRYLLDILYHVCRHKEIEESSSLPYPFGDTRGDKQYTAKKAVHQQLRQILNEKDEAGKERYVLWCDEAGDEYKKGHPIYCILNGNDLWDDEALVLQAAMRAILLFYWTKGLTVNAIKKKTKFDDFLKGMSSGDIERLAEVVSFHMDAILRCLREADSSTGDETIMVFETNDALRAFYALQTRVKYGMPRDLVQFANKHIHGLDRARLLKLKAQADKQGVTPLHFLYFAPEITDCITQSQKAQLISALQRAGFRNERDTLSESVVRAAGPETAESEVQALKQLAEWDDTESDSTERFYNALSVVAQNPVLEKSDIFSKGKPHKIRWMLGGTEIRIYVLTPNAVAHSQWEATEKDAEDLFLTSGWNGNAVIGRILIVQHEADRETLERIAANRLGAAVMDNAYFALVVANAIRLNLGSHTLGEYLADQRGIFTKINGNDSTLLRYVKRNNPQTEKPGFRLLSGNHGGFSNDALQLALSGLADLRNYEELPWGSGLYSDENAFTDCPTIICLNRKQIVGSESLNRFMYRMSNQNFHNCLLLLSSETEKSEWDTEAVPEERGQNRWNGQLRRNPKVVNTMSEAIQEIRVFLNEWRHPEYLIGISYAHYDPVVPGDESWCSNDVDRLHKIATMLRDEYGEDRILYDRFLPAKTLFPDGKAREKALGAYRTCKYYLILWNYWTKENSNCQDERNEILPRCDKGEANCMFLQGGHNVPEPPSRSYYTTSLNDQSIILEKIREYLKDLKD